MIYVVLMLLAAIVVAGFVLLQVFPVLIEIYYEKGRSDGMMTVSIPAPKIEPMERHEKFTVQTEDFEFPIEKFLSNRMNLENHLKKQITMCLAEYLTRRMTIRYDVIPADAPWRAIVRGRTTILVPKDVFNQEEPIFEQIDEWGILS